MTPLYAGVGNVGMRLMGGGIFAAALRAVCNLVIKRLR